jgi:hypothetical protein
MAEQDEPKKQDDEEKIQDLELDESEEGEEITERVRGGLRRNITPT